MLESFFFVLLRQQISAFFTNVFNQNCRIKRGFLCYNAKKNSDSLQLAFARIAALLGRSVVKEGAT